MRPSPHSIANGAAWLGIFALIGLALSLVWLLGFPAVVILGLLTALICTRAELSEDVPSWSQALFESRMAGSRSPEERAAGMMAREHGRSPLRYYRRCGFALIAIGLLGTAWQFSQFWE